jgi:hypothetical protein
VIRPESAQWRPVCPSVSTKKSLRTGAGRNAVYQLAALTMGARLVVADA